MKQCYKMSSDSWIAAGCHPQNLLKGLGSVFLGRNQRMTGEYSSAYLDSTGIINNTDIFGISGLRELTDKAKSLL